MTPPLLSVIVCTLDRYDDLSRCLAALHPAAQCGAPDYEVLVIDQTPQDRRRPVISDPDRVQHIVQEETGLSVARNLGIDRAQGQIIAFLDDDAVACPDWARHISAPFFRPDRLDVQAAGGKVVPEWPGSLRPTWMTAMLEGYLSCIDWGQESRLLKPQEWVVGANMAFRREVFETYGRFDAALGRNGSKSLLSNEELALIRRIGEHRIFYAAEAEVRHIIPPARVKQSWFRKRAYWQGISDLLSGSVWATQVQARAWLGEFIARSPAELRSMLALFAECDGPDAMDMQVRAVYSLAVLGSEGFMQA